MEPAVAHPGVSNILVVDDTPENLQVLSGMLKGQGYRVRPVPSGRLALQAARNDPPDLILLDINMPEMNGYEVCERLKLDERLRPIPVIFISVLNETADKLKAFRVGGVDYVTKPFQFEEVEARVGAHLKLRGLQVELGRQNHRLQESYDKLCDLESLRDNLCHMIVHDLRTPLTAVKGFMQLLEMTDGQNLSEGGRESVRKATGATETLVEMVSSLLDVSRMESGEMKLSLSECDLVSVARDVLGKMESLRGGRTLSLAMKEERILLTCDSDLISRTLQNLLGNALKFTPPDGEVRVGIEPGVGTVRVFVADNGPGIPPEYHKKIFEKFGQVEARSQRQKHSTGLGLTFCKLAVEAHGGQIGVDSEVGKGSTFWFVLPQRR
ncbi:MAG: hypothetical protein A3F84_18375 [Candidatus Handelsmanbacteria bacterium RIFCSPLOWO2_12_FULL_64_10]|uniref:histidine kinase n=1 Tax=Handelsmanbacteria sp. (strain RIFCSPLOWO2_12_FULL_64_10) TaxID=1817868 RepID=A0A1F6CT52_HANXR|nr:MAG: hypothetical protein A3F84_18375 [Candidatus Handelsmanbacteria bacterium RIFCSPLOWO2_12_FULL_64_10]